jgi:uncharacterized membrane protein YheB (UPF0754 family)
MSQDTSKWQALLARHFRLDAWQEMPPVPPAPARAATHWRVRLLMAIPYLCLALWVLSFWLPLRHAYWTLWPGLILPLEGLLPAIAMGGLIGYGTNWLAIKMLFHPREKRPLLGQGLVPAQRERLAIRLAQSIHTHILNEQAILARIADTQLVPRLLEDLNRGLSGLSEDPDFQHEVASQLGTALSAYMAAPEQRAALVTLIDEQIRDASAGKLLPSLYLRLNARSYRQALDGFAQRLPQNLEAWLAKQLPLWLPQWTQQLAAQQEALAQAATQGLQAMAARAQLQQLLIAQLRSFDASRLEDLLWGSTNQQLRYIQYLGGLLGMLGGLVIWQPLVMGGALLGLGLAIWATDVVWARLRAPSSPKMR